MLRKNVASQYLYFALVNSTNGAALTGATVTGKRAIDGAAQASVTGTISEEAGGQYKLALSQADSNGNDIGFLFTATNAVPVSVSVVTTAADPTDSVRFGLTALPNAAASAVGGLPVAVDTSGRVDVLKINGTSQTARDIGASVLVGDKTGFSLSTAGILAIWHQLTAAIVTASTIGKLLVDNIDAAISSRNATTPPAVTAIRAEMDSNSTKLANLDAAVSTRSTYAGGDTPGVTTLLSRLTSTRAALLDNLDTAVSGVAAAVWGVATRTLSAFGFTVSATADPNVALIKAKTDNLPASPAAVGSAMTLTSAYDAAKTAGNATIANQTAIAALIDALLIPTSAENADAVLGRNLAGGSDGGRTVQDALRAQRNKVTITPIDETSGTITVYAEDDSTIAWTGTVTLAAGASPITAVDPA